MKEIKLYGGKISKVDDEDFERVNQYKWYVKRLRYVDYAISNSHIKGKSRKDKDRNKNILMHRIILGLKRNDGKYVDHKDGDGLNNQKANMRMATNQQNCWNRKNYKGYLGVSKCCDGTDRFRVRVGKVNYGQYRDDRTAALVHDEVARKMHGEFASLNLPNERLPEGFKIINFTCQPRTASKRSGVPGVVWHKAKNRWRVIVNKKTIAYTFDLKEAIKIRKKYED